jgi:hypothetical protein
VYRKYAKGIEDALSETFGVPKKESALPSGVLCFVARKSFKDI